MKENILDILVYLLENFIYGDINDSADHASLKAELLRAGFPDQEIEKAFFWLEGLARLREHASALPVTSRPALRVYTTDEIKRLDTESRGFIMFLEQLGVLDPLSRELVIDRYMALGAEEADLIDLKWVILMVLFNQPGKEAAFAWMEDLVYEGTAGWLH